MVFSPLKLDLRPVTQHETQNGVEISLKLPMVLKKKMPRQDFKRCNSSDILLSSQAKQEEFQALANSKRFKQIKARVSSCCSFYGPSYGLFHL